MDLISEGVLALLSALGLTLLAGLLVGRLLSPLSGGGQRLLIPGTGAGDGLEQAVRGAMWLRSLGLLRCPVAIVDVDLTQEGKQLALRLTSRWSGVQLCPADGLGAWLRTTK